MKPFNEHGTEKVSLNNGESFLHGDVIIEKISALPDDFATFDKEPNDALAYGEHTGHLHKLFQMQDPDLMTGAAFDLRIDKNGTKWLLVSEPVCLKHQEHSPRIFDKGLYKIGIQREYDPFTKLARQVAD